MDASDAMLAAQEQLAGGLHVTALMKSTINVNEVERWASAIGGAAVAAAGVKRFLDEDRAAGALISAAGAALIWRGATGHCHVYDAAGINTARKDDTRARLSGTRGVNVEEAVTIARTAYDLYEQWRTLEWLPNVLPDLVSVARLDDRRSHWIARGPHGYDVEWTADIINEVPPELIAWRTLEDSDLVSAGSVHFSPATGNRGTIVRVRLQYDPPGGKVGAAVAWLMGREPAQVLREGLRRFKQLMEAADIASS